MECAESMVISVEMGDDRAVGAITHLSHTDIVVRMIEPWPGLSTGLHIPYFAAHNKAYARDGALTSCGKETTETLLRELLVGGRVMERERGPLLQEIARLRTEIERESRPSQPISPEEFYAARRSLRTSLRAGMAPKEYQRQLKGLKARLQTSWRMEWDLATRLWDLIKARHGVWVPNIEQWIARIEGTEEEQRS